jgi:ABC-type phosphate transport system auxiliary subunit
MTFPVQLVLAALSGGAAWKVIEWAIDYAGLRKNARADFREDLLSRVRALQQRVDQLESALQDEQRARVRAEIQNEVLSQRIEILVQELNRLRDNLEMDPIDVEDFQVDAIPLASPIAENHD